MQILKRLYSKLFVGSRNYGVYPDVASARRAIPSRRKIGYNHAESANLYPWLTEHTKISDFPVLFYFSQLVTPGTRIFDFGGNIGVLYYAYQRRWPLPPDVEWIVCDVPAVVEAGAECARNRPSPGLRFTSNFEEAAGTDILLTSGTLQFVEQDFSSMLEGLGGSLPPHVFVNRIPAWDKPPMVTLHDLGPVICPYRVFNQAQFTASMTGAGYSVLDSWDCPERVLAVHLRPRAKVRGYRGFYFGQPGIRIPAAPISHQRDRELQTAETL